MIYSLGGSKSYGRLSLKAKVLWPMLIAAADDQGRFDAEPDAVKWQVCQNVEEIALDDVPDLLAEMVSQGMLLLYGDKEPLGQILKWWRYQPMAYARPSKYPAPEGWVDRIRYRQGEEWTKRHWGCPGGFEPCECDDSVTYQKRIRKDSDKRKEGKVKEKKEKVKKSSPKADATGISSSFIESVKWQDILIQLKNLTDREAVVKHWTSRMGIKEVTHAAVVIAVPKDDVGYLAHAYKRRLGEAIGLACPDWAEREVILEGYDG
jgi:hypothetical protein